MSRQADFAADHLSFDEGLERLLAITREAGISQEKKLVTSRDKEVAALNDALRVTAVPGGFHKWQLPVYLREASQLYITVGEPYADVPEHSHPEGDGIRFIMSGSIHYGGHELTAGDWMFIPAGVPYSMRVGRLGALMCYCYCCCCAGRMDLRPGDLVERER